MTLTFSHLVEDHVDQDVGPTSSGAITAPGEEEGDGSDKTTKDT